MNARHRILYCTIPLLLLAGCGESVQDHFRAAQAAYAAEDYAGARRELLAALRKEPKDPALLSLMVASLLRLGDADGAQAAIERLRRTNFTGPELARYESEAALLAGQGKRSACWARTITRRPGASARRRCCSRMTPPARLRRSIPALRRATTCC
jgi:hypothetical protein